jgi:epoxyqueuosine reductase
LQLSPERALQWDDATWDEQLRASALRRIKPWMWRRNIAAAMQATRGVAQPDPSIDQPMGQQINGNP